MIIGTKGEVSEVGVGGGSPGGAGWGAEEEGPEALGT